MMIMDNNDDGDDIMMMMVWNWYNYDDNEDNDNLPPAKDSSQCPLTRPNKLHPHHKTGGLRHHCRHCYHSRHHHFRCCHHCQITSTPAMANPARTLQATKVKNSGAKAASRPPVAIRRFEIMKVGFLTNLTTIMGKVRKNMGGWTKKLEASKTLVAMDPRSIFKMMALATIFHIGIDFV